MDLPPRKRWSIVWIIFSSLLAVVRDVICQTWNAVFYHIYKQRGESWKHDIDELWSVWKCDQTLNSVLSVWHIFSIEPESRLRRKMKNKMTKIDANNTQISRHRHGHYSLWRIIIEFEKERKHFLVSSGIGHNINLQIDISFLCVCPVFDHEFRHHIVKVAVDPRGDSRVDPQTTLTMLWRNSLSITGQTH